MIPKVLLIAGFLPEGGGGGGVNLRSLLDSFPSEKLTWLAMQKDSTLTTWWRPEVSRYSVTRRIPGRRYSLISWLWNNFLFRWEANEAVAIAQQINGNWKPDCLWVIVDQNTLFAAYSIVKKLGLPWHITVQDDPEISRKLLGEKLPESWRKMFDKLYIEAKSRDCTSYGMTEFYKRRYNKDAFMVSRTILPSKVLEARSRVLFKNNQINILMGGWGDCPPPWPKNLITALEILEEKTNKKVVLHAFDPALAPFKGELVEIHGRLPEPEFNKLLEKMDLGYAPDPFTEEAKEFVQTSLSTKLVTYIASTLPCVYHGPSLSSGGEMFSRFKAGEIVDSQDPEVLADGFLKLISDSESYRDEAVRLAQADFDPGVLIGRIMNRF